MDKNTILKYRAQRKVSNIWLSQYLPMSKTSTLLNYWESHYRKGGSSGEGSIGEYREWKWNNIYQYVNAIDNVIDVGCGDLSFWQGKTCKTYTGIDLSQFILNENKNKRPEWNFICASADNYQPIKAPIIFCFDVLFHILDENVYVSILNNLAKYSDKWIFIYTWYRNPFDDYDYKKMHIKSRLLKLKFGEAIDILLRKRDTDNIYQKYRNFSKYYPIFEDNGFKLISVDISNKFPYGAMYIFKK